MKDWTFQDIHIIANNMIKHGDDFMRQIGYSLKIADVVNYNKLAKTFAKEFTKFYEY